jgi:hypothetical protein
MSFNGETDEDRFFGFVSASGIGALRITATGGGGIEIDHIQYSLKSPVAATSSYGSACFLSSSVAPTIGSNSPPVIGNSGFAIDVSAPVSSVPTALAVAYSPGNGSIGACQILVGGGEVFAGNPLLSQSGQASVSIPIPNVGQLLGVSFYAQWVVVDSSGPLLGFASTSGGMAVTLGL